MKKLKIPLAVLGVLVMVAPAFGDRDALIVRMTQTGGIYSYGYGGEFTVYQLNTAAHLDTDAYSYLASNIINPGSDGSFQTFCLETTEYEYNTQQVDVAINESGSPLASYAVYGSVGPSGDPISPKTAYLYDQFARGVLNGYDYTNTGVGRQASARALQEAIWTIEQELNPNTASTWAYGDLTTLGQTFYDDAGTETAGVGGYWFDKYGANGIGGVRVLNAYQVNKYPSAGQDNYRRQDMLWLETGSGSAIPAPGALVLGLMGLGILGVKMRKYA